MRISLIIIKLSAGPVIKLRMELFLWITTFVLLGLLTKPFCYGLGLTELHYSQIYICNQLIDRDSVLPDRHLMAVHNMCV